MNIFLSWSGEGSQSHQLAKALKDWLPRVIQSLRPWLSSSDIGKGLPWLGELQIALSSTADCILCVTPESLASPWLVFEAGIVASKIGTTRVTPVLLHDSTLLSGPLSQFQSTRLVKSEMLDLLQGINERLGEQKLQPHVLLEEFEAKWARFFETVVKIRESAPTPKEASDREMLKEILSSVRSLAREPEPDVQDALTSSLVPGTRVSHPSKYGDGRIVSVQKRGAHVQVAVRFDDGTTRHILGSYLVPFTSEKAPGEA